jgi:hypothetical protein
MNNNNNNIGLIIYTKFKNLKISNFLTKLPTYFNKYKFKFI